MSGEEALENDDDEDPEGAGKAEPREAHPNNPLVTRGSSGVWGDDILPVTDWEAAGHRVVLPESLRARSGMAIAVLRWDAEKYTRVVLDHPRDAHVLKNLPQYLEGWEFVGQEVRSGNQRVLFRDEAGRWYAFSMGELQGSLNAITLIGGSAPSFKDNRLRGMNFIQVRKNDR